MLLAADSAVATFFALVFVAAVVGIPISIAVVNNRQHSQATRYAHMEGWAHGTPLSTAQFFPGGAPSEKQGPRIVAYGNGSTAKAIRIVNSQPPPRQEPGALIGHSFVVVARPGDDDTNGIARPATGADDLASTAGERLDAVQVEPGLSFVPPVPAPLPEGTAEARVLGDPRVLGWIAEPTRRNLIELCC